MLYTLLLPAFITSISITICINIEGVEGGEPMFKGDDYYEPVVEHIRKRRVKQSTKDTDGALDDDASSRPEKPKRARGGAFKCPREDCDYVGSQNRLLQRHLQSHGIHADNSDGSKGEKGEIEEVYI